MRIWVAGRSAVGANWHWEACGYEPEQSSGCPRIAPSEALCSVVMGDENCSNLLRRYAPLRERLDPAEELYRAPQSTPIERGQSHFS